MLAMYRSFQDLFGSKKSLKLTKCYISYGIMCHMALSGLKGLTDFTLPSSFSARFFTQ